MGKEIHDIKKGTQVFIQKNPERILLSDCRKCYLASIKLPFLKTIRNTIDGGWFVVVGSEKCSDCSDNVKVVSPDVVYIAKSEEKNLITSFHEAYQRGVI